MKKIIKIIILNTAILFLILILLEILLRLFFPQHLRDDLFTRGHIYKEDGKNYVLKPNHEDTHATPEFNVTCRINSLGLRSPEFDPQDGKYPILFLGDSFTFGFGVENHETFSEQLDRLIQDNDYQGFRVINGGLSGASNYHSLYIYRYYKDILNPKLTVLFLYVGNDMSGNYKYVHQKPRKNWDTEAQSFSLKKWFGVHSHLYSLISLRFDTLLRKLRIRKGDRGDVAVFFQKAPSNYVIESLRATESCLRQFKEEALNQNGTFLIAIIPHQVQISRDTWKQTLDILRLDPKDYDSLKPIKDIKRICRRLDIACLNLRSFFKDHPEYYYKVDTHLNPAGHKRLAEILFDHLEPYLKVTPADEAIPGSLPARHRSVQRRDGGQVRSSP